MTSSILTLEEKIRQRRAQMIVHSYAYERLNISIVSDHKWQQWADELVELQKQCLIIGFYDDEFADWTGATGSHLPQNAYAHAVAMDLINSVDPARIESARRLVNELKENPHEQFAVPP